MKSSALLLLACLPFATQAASIYVGDRIFVAPFASDSTANLIGNVTLPNAGTYSATDWFIVGNVRLGASGEYTLTATGGSIHITGQLFGPAGGHVTLRIQHRGNFSVVGVVDSNITIIDTTVPSNPITTWPIGAAVPLTNLSTRASLGNGQVLNFGFVIGGNVARRVLIRAIGPGLTPFGVSHPMADPMLTVFSGTMPVATNDDWMGAADLSAAFAAVGAFSVPASSHDAAIALTLSPGAYTVVARSTTPDDSGEVLAEVYFVE